jgi:hypothetical protein
VKFQNTVRETPLILLSVTLLPETVKFTALPDVGANLATVAGRPVIITTSAV